MTITKGRRYVEVINFTGQSHRIYDRELPGGYVDIGSHETYELPAAVFMRHLRPCKRWMMRSTECRVQSTEFDLSGLKMTELRKLAKERGLAIPFQIKKVELISLIQGA